MEQIFLFHVKHTTNNLKDKNKNKTNHYIINKNNKIVIKTNNF